MKGFGFAILCLIVAVQGDNLAGQEVEALSGIPAQPGNNPWIVHLRIATAIGGGFLDTCLASLIDPSWVLTSATCVQHARFIWLRYGALNVIRPELVTESSVVRVNPGFNGATGANNIALIGINRVVQPTDNIFPIRLVPFGAPIPFVARFCGYGSQNNVPAELLRCADVSLNVAGDGNIHATSPVGQPTRFDFGGPLVSGGVQVGVLTSTWGRTGVFQNPARFRQWIQDVSGVRV